MKYVSIRNKLASVAVFLNRELKARDHEVDDVKLDLLHNDVRNEVSEVVRSLFDCVNDAFSDLINAPDFNDVKLQNRFVRAAAVFDGYCEAYHVDPVVMIIINDGDECDVYHVDNTDAELAVKLVA